MKNFKYFPISLLILLMSCNPNENNSKIVLETTGFADSTKIFLVNTETVRTDSGYIINNNLVFYADVDEPTKFFIKPVIRTRADIDVKYFWKENKLLTIKGEKGNLEYAKVEGSVIQIQADAVDASKNHLKQINDSLLSVYKSWDKEDTEGKSAIRKKGKEITQAITDVEINYVKNNPDELYSAITLKQLMTYTIPKEKTKALYENLSVEMQETKYGITIKKYLDLSLDLKIGDQAADFQLPDLDGNLVGLNDFKGKYILLDFWGSGCGPCRMENPNLLRYYKAYREKGFEIISISFDKNRDDWANAVEEDSMIWTTVCDLRGIDGDVMMTYNAYLMPTYFLIDPNGVIIEKFLGRGGPLDNKLKEIFQKPDTIVIKEISKELYVCSCKPDISNPGGEGKIYFQGKYIEDLVTKDADYRNCDERFLVQWNLSAIPKDATIVEAKMEIYCRSYNGDKKGQLIYEYITEPWNTDIGFSKIPNTSTDGRVLTDWPKVKEYHSIDITNFIKNWYNNKTPNFGLMGYSINTNTKNSAIFCSSKFPDETLHPKLTIIYRKN